MSGIATEKKLDPTERMNLTLSASAVAASFALAGPHFAGSLAVGAMLEALNFRALHRGARLMFGGELVGGGVWVALLAMRFSLLTLGIAAAIYFGANPLGLVLGLSLVMPAVVIGALRNRPPVIDQPLAEALAPDDPSWDEYSIWHGREVKRDQEEDE